VEIIRRLNISEILDRRGSELFCAGDDLFSWVAASTGKGFGVFPELRVIHLIVASRLRPSYFLRLIYGWWLSEGVVNYLMGGIRPKRNSLTRSLRICLSGLRHGPFQMRYRIEAARGEAAAHRLISEKGLIPIDRTPAAADRALDQSRKHS
jgi:hypothetical protein